MLAEHEDLEDFVGHAVDVQRADLLLAGATGVVDDVAGAPILEVSGHVEDVDGSGTPVLLLGSFPVTAVASVAINGDTVDADGYAWSRTGVLERSSGRWPKGRRNITVTYTHGYPPGEVPADLKLVCLTVAARLLANPQMLMTYNGDSTSVQFTVSPITDVERDIVLRALK